MGGSRREMVVGCAVLAVACSFEGTQAVGSADGGSTADASTASSGSGATTSASTASATGTASGGDSASGSATGGAETTSQPGDGVLEISDGPIFDYGHVLVGQTDVHVFTVNNVGDAAATAVAGASVPSPFEWEGGTFPGSSGDCGAVVDAGRSCLIAVTFAPNALAIHADNVAVDYDTAVGPGQARRAVEGVGAGRTDNLLVNGDAETPGNPPPGWTETIGTSWQTNGGEVTPHGGSLVLWAATPAANGEASMRQDIDLSGFAPLIDAGLLQIEFSGWTRGLSGTQDPHNMVLLYGDEMQAELGRYETPFGVTGGWQQYQDSRIAPSTTRSLRLVLNCRLVSGVLCDGFYDDLSVVAVVPQ